MAIWSAEIKDLKNLYESFKGNLPLLEKELERLTGTDDENMVLLYSRRALEVIITDLCECELQRPRKTEPLKGIIDKLHKEEKVPAHIITSMHGLNDLSNYGAHPREFEPEQVKPVLVNLNIIIKWYLRWKESRIAQETGTIPEKQLFSERKEETAGKGLSTKTGEKISGTNKQKVLSGLVLLSIILLTAIFLYPKIFRKDRLSAMQSSGGRIAVAVMPFQNLTNDSTWNIWQGGIQDNLITTLSNSSDLKVRHKESVNRLIQNESGANYASVIPSIAKIISQKLEVDIFISGSLNQAGSVARINAQLIDSKTDEVYKSFQIDGSPEEMLHSIDSLSSMVMNFLIIARLIRELPPYLQLRPLTTSPEAYSCYLQGENARSKRDYPLARKMYAQALSIDSNYHHMRLLLSVACINQGLFEEARNWSDKAYEKIDQMPLRLQILTNSNHASFHETPLERIKYTRQFLEIDDKFPGTYYDIGLDYNSMLQYDKAIPYFEKSLEIYDKIDMKPWWIYNYTELGYAYHETGRHKKEERLYKRADKDFPDEPGLVWRKAILYLTTGDTVRANELIRQYRTIYRDNSWSGSAFERNMGWAYTQADMPDKAEESFRKSVALDDKNPVWSYYLAYFLIDQERNVDEGLELIDKVLEQSKGQYEWIFLDCKGWGLHKQGNYREALDILQKSWDLRRTKAEYDHKAFLHLEAAKKAVAAL
ncbi:MAG TPA: hypothetical protein DDW27_18860 [Bacteroidales bacterium]|nr:hypothetical protein [Bacteroidales bacterium]